MSSSNFCLNSDFHVNLWIFYMPQIYDMGPTALLPLRRKACWGFFRPKNPTASAGFEPANLATKDQKSWTYVTNTLKLTATVHPYIQFSCYNTHLSLWMLLLTHKSKYSLCIFIRLLFGRCTTIFPIIGQFWSTSQVTYGITIDDRGTSTSYHCPNTSRFIEDCQLQKSNNFTLQ